VLFRRAMAVGAAKSVTFGNKKSVKFENSFQKVLEIKKNLKNTGCAVGHNEMSVGMPGRLRR
jgi:hypothetical protein